MSEALPDGFEPEPGGPATGRTLAIILHGWTGSRSNMRDVCCATRQAFANADGVDLFVPQLQYSSWLSFASPVDITSKLLANIDQLCLPIGRYARIYLIGHSVGSVIARRIFLIAAGMNTTLPSEGCLGHEPERPWAARVCRIVTLGGLNRGWPRSGRIGWLELLVGFAVGMIGHGWPGSSKPVMFHARRGAPFIVQNSSAVVGVATGPLETQAACCPVAGYRGQAGGTRRFRRLLCRRCVERKLFLY